MLVVTVLHLVVTVLHYMFSAYMAIFRCVRYFCFHIPEGICFVVFVAFSCMWLHYARFHLWGRLNMRYYYLLLFMLFFVLLYTCFLLTYVFADIFIRYVNFV
jgi:hypothetical protein